MKWREAVYEVMKKARKPLSYDEVCEEIKARGLRKLTGKTPWQTVGGVLYGNPLYRLVDTAKFVLTRHDAAMDASSETTKRPSAATPMPFLDAAEHVLRQRGEPMYWRDLGEAVERLVSSDSADVANTLTGRVAQDIKTRADRGERQRFCRPARGFIGLARQPRVGGRARSDNAVACAPVPRDVDAEYDAGLSSELRALDNRISRVELRLRETIRNILGDDNALVPAHVMQEVNRRLLSAGRRSARLGIEHSADLSTRLQYCDLRELQGTIVSDSLWPRFARMFAGKETLNVRFDQLAELRNTLRHIRTLDEIALKEGEAALIWFERILRQWAPASTKVAEEGDTA
jgi:hypothetical protein